MENKSLDLIVCHRGLHDPDLLDRTRPVENSLAAYRKAWKYFTLCECDVTVSKDGELYLCHDETFRRVLDDPHNQPLADTQVCDLFSAQIDTLKLLDGSSPPRLAQVLEVAQSYGPTDARRLVVELKKDKAYQQVIQKLCEFLEAHNDLASHVAVIMSFDLGIMEALGEWRTQTSQKESIKHINFMLLTEAPAHFDAANNTILADVCSSNFRVNCERLVRDSKLDGVYLEFQEEMITNTILSLEENKIQDELATLARSMPVGVWNYSTTQPDGLVTLERFAQLGLKYVNSDLPENELNKRGIGTKPERESCLDALWLSLFCVYGVGRKGGSTSAV